jgi:hypothetical protein
VNKSIIPIVSGTFSTLNAEVGRFVGLSSEKPNTNAAITVARITVIAIAKITSITGDTALSFCFQKKRKSPLMGE